uniref:SnoaL-like domain-containing protein n=1 Tax=Panagrolaimus sp. JU765 TaxID=591449 RepID=A0AC34QXP3_9BILA
MGLSQQEIDEKLKKCQDEFAAVWATGSAEKLADLYHPHAVMVHAGHKSIYGRENIIATFKEFIASPSDFSVVADQNLEAGDGLYLIQKGRFVLSKDGKNEEFPYEQIFKREPDGSYLIYHDEFHL